MKPSEIRDLSASEVTGKEQEKAEELANLKFQLALHQLDNKSKVKTARRELARLKTIRREHELKIRILTEDVSKGESV